MSFSFLEVDVLKPLPATENNVKIMNKLMSWFDPN